MKLTLIISYYKNLDNLKLILNALNKQSDKNFEVIISEDDNNEETVVYLKENVLMYEFPIEHLCQEFDDGFRKNAMLNRSIVKSKGEIIVFIDGDCIPHRHFIKEYNRNCEVGYILWGRRVMLGEKLSKKLLDNGSTDALSLGKVLMSKSSLVKEAIYSPKIDLSSKQRGLLGCNWGVRKVHLIEVNGFDEDYVKPGVGEDVDIEWRLKSLGLKMKSMKNKAIVYHMFHERSYSEDGVQFNYKLLSLKQEEASVKCKNGILKF